MTDGKQRGATRRAEGRFVTPEEYAARLGVSHSKVLKWIGDGELVAMDTSSGGVKPRWLITAEAIADFEVRRSNKPKAAKALRQRKPVSSSVPRKF